MASRTLVKFGTDHVPDCVPAPAVSGPTVLPALTEAATSTHVLIPNRPPATMVLRFCISLLPDSTTHAVDVVLTVVLQVEARAAAGRSALMLNAVNATRSPMDIRIVDLPISECRRSPALHLR